MCAAKLARSIRGRTKLIEAVKSQSKWKEWVNGFSWIFYCSSQQYIPSAKPSLNNYSLKVTSKLEFTINGWEG